MSVEKNRDAFIPSVCFSVRGPDPDLLDQIDKYIYYINIYHIFNQTPIRLIKINRNSPFFSRLKLKYDQINENVNRFDAYLKKENVSRIMKTILKESQTGKFLSTINRSNLENMIDNVREEIESIISTSQTISRPSNNSAAGGGSGKSSKRSASSSTLRAGENEISTSLLSEFKDFDRHLRQLLDSNNKPG